MSYTFSGTFSLSTDASACASATASASKTASTTKATRADSDPTNAANAQSGRKRIGPTIDAPFEFVEVEAPGFVISECSDDEPEQPRPIGIPQTEPSATSPFVVGYPQSLRNYGIREETWTSFVETVSAFLEATVPENAVNHAVDVATRIGKRPKKLASNVFTRTISIGQEIGQSAKQGHLFGVATGIIKGAVSIPLNLTMSTATAVLGLPISTAIALTRRPPTARERVAAYLAVANEQWLIPQKLFATIADTEELGQLLGVPISSLPIVEETDDNGTKTEEIQYSLLESHVEALKSKKNTLRHIGISTLWLVVTPVT